MGSLAKKVFQKCKGKSRQADFGGNANILWFPANRLYPFEALALPSPQRRDISESLQSPQAII
jgi:hypothetical protein